MAKGKAVRQAFEVPRRGFSSRSAEDPKIISTCTGHLHAHTSYALPTFSPSIHIIVSIPELRRVPALHFSFATYVFSWLHPVAYSLCLL